MVREVGRRKDESSVSGFSGRDESHALVSQEKVNRIQIRTEK